MKETMLLKIECNTLEEVEQYIKREKVFPDIVVIGSNTFERAGAYKGSCNEVYNCYEHHFNDDIRSSISYTFSCTYGDYIDSEDCYRVNTYNFCKYEILK